MFESHPRNEKRKMKGDLAIVEILLDDDDYSDIVGESVFYDEADQTTPLPFSIVRTADIEPADDKDGPATLDHDFVYVTHFAKDKVTVSDMAQKARTAADRTSGTYNDVVVQSIQFLTQRSGSELLVNKKTLTIEQQYKIITTQ